MSENGARRRPRVLSPEAKWEIFLEVTSREVTQAEAARRHSVDVSTVIGIRRTVKDAALAALAARPGRRAKERNWELEQAQREVGQLTEAVKSQAIELAAGEKPAGPERCCAREGPRAGQRAVTTTRCAPVLPHMHLAKTIIDRTGAHDTEPTPPTRAAVDNARRNGLDTIAATPTSARSRAAASAAGWAPGSIKPRTPRPGRPRDRAATRPPRLQHHPPPRRHRICRASPSPAPQH